MFLFDVHSTHKIDHVFQSQTFADAAEDISLIWNAFPGEAANSVEHELTFFIRTENGLYERFDELHQQRTFPPDLYKKWLNEAGFIEAVTADFTNDAPTNESERIFFKAKKSG